MKLIRFGKKGEEKPGVVVNKHQLDCSAHFEDWNRSFFQNGGVEKLKKVLAENTLPVVDENERWGSPIARPGMIACIGLNYSDHAKEAGMALPEEPIVFMKAANTIGGPYDAVAIPKDSKTTDWEVELGIVLGQDVSYLEDEKAAEAAIAGYCVVNDVSERIFQLRRGGQWTKGKSCPGFCPTGPYLVTKEAIEDIHNLKMTLSVNGQLMQNGTTHNMIFKPAYIVWYLSQFMQLEAGDLISTGTPAGVGSGRNPRIFLKKGDKVVLGIEGLGEQQLSFV